jgi:hypothetical protein
MYLSAERLAIADREVIETFGQTSIAWQAIPHWDTGDPGGSRVRNDVVDNPGFLDLMLKDDQFQATLAQLGAPTPDSLLAEVMARTAKLAAKVDWEVIHALRIDPTVNAVAFGAVKPEDIMNGLIDARALVEDAGYRAPSCLITNTEGLKKLNAFSSGYPVTDSILNAANISSLHRTSQFTDKAPDDPTNQPPAPPPKDVLMILLGRRERIAYGAAADASPGEEPVDLAVSVLPSLELVGEAAGDLIELAARIRFVTRIKDPKGVVLLTK